jgi:hypothetical protein
MKNILSRQLVFMPILYISAKMIWGLMPIDKLPEMLKGTLSDLFGPALLMLVILLIFIQIFWKILVLERLTQFWFGTKPNLQGTWAGKLKYVRNDKKLEKTVFLVIKQANGYSLDIWLLTNERTSSSIFANITDYRGEKRIIYTYSMEESPDNRIKNPSHEGFCRLDILNASNNLKGIYYTIRETSGELIFDKKSKKIIRDFEKAQKIFEIE